MERLGFTEDHSERKRQRMQNNEPAAVKLGETESATDCATLPSVSDATGTKLSEPSHCQYFVARKKRHCKATPAVDRQFCIEHAYLQKDDGLRKRIPCPLDSKHSCYEDNLQKHLKKCNSRPELRPIFYTEGLNSGDCEKDISISNEPVSVKTADEEELVNLIKKVRRIYRDEIGEVRKEVLFHNVMQEEHDKPVNGVQALRHIKQQASLIGHMDRLGFLQNNHCFIEFGAGKGGLSHWVQLSVNDKKDTQFILFDKSAVRYKMDNYHKRDDQGPNFERVKIDIEHLNLCGVPSLQDNPKPLIGMGKHLCGAATDFMLRCLATTLEEKTGNQKRSMKGVVLALCCHHRCTWKSYVGKDWMLKHDMSAREFMLLCSMTSWATCNSKHVDVTEGNDQEQSTTYNHHRYGSLLPQEREELGFMSKNIIDFGRSKFLEDFGFKSEIVLYVDRNLTLENTALLAQHCER